MAQQLFTIRFGSVNEDTGRVSNCTHGYRYNTRAMAEKVAQRYYADGLDYVDVVPAIDDRATRAAWADYMANEPMPF